MKKVKDQSRFYYILAPHSVHFDSFSLTVPFSNAVEKYRKFFGKITFASK